VLKLIFWSLLSINGLLFAYGQGYLGNFKGNEREPARLRSQVAPDKLVLLSAASAAAAAAPPAPLEPAPAAPETIACIEIGPFNGADARRFDALLAPLGLGQRKSTVSVPSTEISSHIVHIPSLGSKENADKKAEELKNMGVSNYFIISDNSPMKWAISLGVFKSENAAKTLLAALNKQGVTSARILGRTSNATRLNYQLRDLDAGTKAKIEAIVERFPSQDARSCK
jgi:hypothetical protein